MDPGHAYLRSLYPTLEELGDLLAAFVTEHQGGSYAKVMSETYWPLRLSELATGGAPETFRLLLADGASRILLANGTDFLLRA
jgi:hypothetical protein